MESETITELEPGTKPILNAKKEPEPNQRLIDIVGKLQAAKL